MERSRGRPRANPVDAVEAAYLESPGPVHWMTTLLERVRSVIEGGLGVFGWCYDAKDPANIRFHDQVSVDVPDGDVQALFATLTHPEASPALIARHWKMVAGSAMRDLGLHAADYGPFRDLMVPRGIRDIITLNAQDTDSVGCALNAFQGRRVAIGPRMLRRMEWITAHVIAAYRLRCRGLIGTDGAAVVTPTGDIKHASGMARTRRARDALGRATRRLDAVRTRRNRSDVDGALLAWKVLVEGRWTLVERIDSDGRRLFHAQENAPRTTPTRDVLSERERQILALATLGHSNKLIAYDLGLSLSSVSTHMSRALAKMQLRSRVEVLDVGKHHSDVQRSPLSESSGHQLTEAEKAVAEAAARGMSNEDISVLRGSSVRTVVNQMSSVFRKLGVHSRVELASAWRTDPISHGPRGVPVGGA